MFAFDVPYDFDIGQHDVQFNWPDTGITGTIGVGSGSGNVGLTLPGGVELSLSFQPGTGGDAREQATEIVNKAEQVMQSNLAQFQSGAIMARQAQDMFDRVFDWMNQNLSRVSDRNVAARSIQERSRGGIYDYPRAYRDPIAETTVTGQIDSAIRQLTGSGGGLTGGNGMLLWVVIGLVAIMVIRR